MLDSPSAFSGGPSCSLCGSSSRRVPFSRAAPGTPLADAWIGKKCRIVLRSRPSPGASSQGEKQITNVEDTATVALAS